MAVEIPGLRLRLRIALRSYFEIPFGSSGFLDVTEATLPPQFQLNLGQNIDFA